MLSGKEWHRWLSVLTDAWHLLSTPNVGIDREAFFAKVRARATQRLENELPVRVAVLCEALKLRFAEQCSEAQAVQAAEAIFAQRGTPP